MKLFRPNPNKSEAQAIVEFSIVLPILLLLLYGLIETGRLLFIYSSVINASRQAARYGSTSGVGPNGVPRYQDCAGIRAAAQAGDFLDAFDDGDITITYDYGLSPYTAYDTCNGSTDIGVNAGQGDRVNVNIEADFNALVPLVPFISRTNAGGNPIIGSSSRTLLLSISIAPQSTATHTVTVSPTLTPSLTPSTTPTASITPTATQTLQFTHTPSITSPATATHTPTNTPTSTSASVAGCNSTNIILDVIRTTGSTMDMAITNNLTSALTLQNVTVDWYYVKGHQTGGDKTLRLQSAQLGTTIFWTGNNSSGLITLTPVSTTYLPASATTTLSFTFHQSHDNFESGDSMSINFSTPGCEGANPFTQTTTVK